MTRTQEIKELKQAARKANIQLFSPDFEHNLIRKVKSTDPARTVGDLLVETVEETLQNSLYQGLDILALCKAQDSNTRDYSNVCRQALDLYENKILFRG